MEKIDIEDNLVTGDDNLLKSKIEIMNNLEIVNKILNTLNNDPIPNMALIYSPESLEIAEDLLSYLFEKEKQLFNDMLDKDNEQISFDDLVNFKTEFKLLFGVLKHKEMLDGGGKIDEIVNKFQSIYDSYFTYSSNNQRFFNKKYYEKIKYFYDNVGLDEIQLAVLKKYLNLFEMNGINLSEDVLNQIGNINIELSELVTKFQQNVVSEQKQFTYHVLDFKKISNLPKNQLDKAKDNAQKVSKDGYIFNRSFSTYSDIITYCEDEQIRKDFYTFRVNMCSSGDYDNRQLVLRILELRDKKAKLMNYNNYSEYALKTSIAGHPDKVLKLLDEIKSKVQSKVIDERQMLIEYFGLQKIERWNISYYSNKYKKEKLNFDSKIIREYCQIDDIFNHLKNLLKQLLDIELKEIDFDGNYDKENVKFFEVYRNGNLLGHYLLDTFYRSTKRPGAWADNIRSRNFNNKPFVINSLNILKAVDGNPTLIDRNDVKTLYHETGHAMHELLFKYDYPQLTGFEMQYDFVEFISQLLDKWPFDNDYFKSITSHYQTGQPISDEIINILKQLEVYMKGEFLALQLYFAYLDIMLHIQTPTNLNQINNLSEKLGNTFGIKEEGVDLSLYTSMTHLFAEIDGYASKYYSYMWADIYCADSFEYFKELGLFNHDLGNKLVDQILSQGAVFGGDIEYEKFRGKPISTNPFCKRNGLV